MLLVHNIFGGDIMNHINESIGCTVKSCKYHAQEKQYCTLQNIVVGQHNQEAKEKQETDCNSFEYQG